MASDLDGVQWTPQNGEGSTVVGHHADSTLMLNRNVTVYGCIGTNTDVDMGLSDNT